LRAVLREESGRGLPLLYVPGIDGTGELLLGTASRLAERFRLLRLAYCGDVGRARGGSPTYPELAASVAALCDGLGIEACLVVAESFGGAVALQLALDRPDLARGLLVVNSFAHYPARLRLAVARCTSPLVPRALFDLGRRWLAPRSLFGARRDPGTVAAFRSLRGSFFDRAYRDRLAMIAGLDLRPRLGELRQPVALFAGDHDRIVTSRRCMAEIHAGLPDSTLEIVPGGGHLILPLPDEPWPERLEGLAGRAGL